MPLLLSPAAPSESILSLGVSYFLLNYVSPESGLCPGYLNYAPALLHAPGHDVALVRAAVCAVGLAGLANTTGSAAIMYGARASYADALRRVNLVLASPLQACEDSTVLAVVVLGIFETITCTGGQSLEAWTRHIQGVADLVVHRGTSQFGTKLGLHVFQEAISHVLTLCSRHGQAVPPRIRLLRAEAAPLIPHDDPAWTLSSVHVEAMGLYERVSPELTAAFLPDQWEQLLWHTVELDRRLEGLFGRLPARWYFSTVADPGEDPRVVYGGGGVYHVYDDTWVAKVWNGMRACRILLHQVIYCLLVREGPTWAADMLAGGVYAGLLTRAVATTTAMRDDILASVPQMLGFVRRGPPATAPHLDGGRDGVLPTGVPALGAYFLLWPLFLAGSLPMNTPETRDWVVDRLRTIRAATGIQKAEYLADGIQRDPIFAAGVMMTGDAPSTRLRPLALLRCGVHPDKEGAARVVPTAAVPTLPCGRAAAWYKGARATPHPCTPACHQRSTT